jgi:hypothetical protein
MGGVGSENWRRFGKKTTVEECRSLDVRRLHREGPSGARLPILVVLVASGAPDSLHRVCGASGASDGTGSSPISPQEWSRCPEWENVQQSMRVA